jgi:hypothetical protein
MISGSLSDKLGKRMIFVLAGYGLSTISKPFFAASTGWLDVFCKDLEEKKLLGSGGYAFAKLTEQEEIKASLRVPQIFLGNVGSKVFIN